MSSSRGLLEARQMFESPELYNAAFTLKGAWYDNTALQCARSRDNIVLSEERREGKKKRKDKN